MNPRLRALLVGSSIAVVAGIAYFIPRLGVTGVELVDGGIRDDCFIRRVECTFTPPDGGEAEQKDFLLAHCPNPDGGRPERIVPRALAFAARDLGLHDLAGQCIDLGPAGGAFGGAPAPRQSSCACAPGDGGTCRRVDGGPAPSETVMEPGAWTGGCARTPCRPMFGSPSVVGDCR